MSQDSKKSEQSRIEESLASLQRLEQDLEQFHYDHTTGIRRDDSQSIRIRLCELYSDCLLRNPAAAYEHGVLDRLWRYCFYPRIGDERKEIARCKKHKNSNPTAVVTVVANFRRFLQEAMDLYRYLINFYSSLIVTPLEPCEGSSQSYDLTQDDLDEKGKEAVVAILHRFEIYLGDLYRYSEKYQEAALHYERAAMFAPGHGNPYNQLAVLEQLKDSSCNALYWYARSIKASCKPFETSMANIDRLFQSNEKWLLENLSNVHSAPPPKKNSTDSARARKSFASKHFAASFVDLHFHLYKGRSNEKKVDDTNESTNMDPFIKTLDEFLSNNWLSDTLLCRMVAINAFTVSQVNSTLSKILVFRFGDSLAKRVELTLEKMSESGSEGVSSIRGLSALLLTGSFSYFLESHQDTTLHQKAFWAQLCRVGNLVGVLSDKLQLKEEAIKGKKAKEFKEMVGFSPFENFMEKPRPYLTIEEAKERLLFIQNNENSKLTQDGMGNQLDTRIKLQQLLDIMSELPNIENGLDDSFSHAENMELDSNPVESEEVAVDVSMSHIDASQEEKALLLYKTPEYGNGPALLVPTALLESVSSPVNFSGSELDSMTDKNRDPHRIMRPEKSHELSPERQDLNAIVQSPLMNFPLANSSLTHSLLTPSSESRPPPGILPPPGFTPFTEHSASDTNPINLAAPPAWDFLSFLPTANPFANPTTSIPPSSTILENPNDFLDSDDTLGYLDSSLIQSLWLDDTNRPLSNNPFWTGP
jgi:tetratricopeptide (TPR) repeat protein